MYWIMGLSEFVIPWVLTCQLSERRVFHMMQLGEPEKTRKSDEKLINYLWKNKHCVTSDTRVLTRDLRWVPVGDLVVGDDLIGFDEYPGEYYDGGKRSYRSYRDCKVTSTGVKLEEVWQITFKDGSSIRCTGDHRWLALVRRLSTSKNNGGTCAEWCRTDGLAYKINNRRVSLPRPIKPWSTDKFMGCWVSSRCLGCGRMFVHAQYDKPFTICTI